MDRIESEPYKIREEFLSISQKIRKPGKSRRFIGNLFSDIITRKMERYISSWYKIVVGPLWIRGMEWIEWDGAIIKKGAKEIINKLFHPDDIIALFEFKTGGIYGRKHPGKGKTVRDVINDIKEKFRVARKCCSNLKGRFYVSLQERTPKRNDSIDYYGETKKLEPEVVTCILFRSPIEKEAIAYPNEWNKLVRELKQLSMHSTMHTYATEFLEANPLLKFPEMRGLRGRIEACERMRGNNEA